MEPCCTGARSRARAARLIVAQLSSGSSGQRMENIILNEKERCLSERGDGSGSGGSRIKFCLMGWEFIRWNYAALSPRKRASGASE